MAEYSVMIIDDNAEDRYLLSRKLKMTGLDITVFEETDGSAAITFLENYDTNRALYPEDYPPLLLFLDINMPILDGWGFLREFAVLRQRLDIRSSVVIMFTSSDIPEDRDKAKQYEFVREYIVKGDYSPEQLKEALISVHNTSDAGET